MKQVQTKSLMKFVSLLSYGILACCMIGCASKESVYEAGMRQKAREYSYAQRNDYIRQMKKDMAAVNYQMEKIGKIAAKANEETRIEADRRSKELVAMFDDLKKKLDQVKNTQQPDWDRLKTEIDSSFLMFQDNLDQVGVWLNNALNS